METKYNFSPNEKDPDYNNSIKGYYTPGVDTVKPLKEQMINDLTFLYLDLFKFNTTPDLIKRLEKIVDENSFDDKV